MTKELTCIICPRGCTLKIETEGKTVRSVSGNACPRGIRYAESECIAPVRTVTTTMRCKDGRLVPVKTDRPIPKESMMALMALVNATIAPLPITAGDILIKDVYGCNVVATKDM
ncbi:MAG: DUF1667 domain-containing protein [Clostridia bacterium]|nr:DUF1667 domain-containing protein [Clostridia bacterium]